MHGVSRKDAHLRVQGQLLIQRIRHRLHGHIIQGRACSAGHAREGSRPGATSAYTRDGAAQLPSPGHIRTCGKGGRGREQRQEAPAAARAYMDLLPCANKLLVRLQTTQVWGPLMCQPHSPRPPAVMPVSCAADRAPNNQHQTARQ